MLSALLAITSLSAVTSTWQTSFNKQGFECLLFLLLCLLFLPFLFFVLISLSVNLYNLRKQLLKNALFNFPESKSTKVQNSVYNMQGFLCVNQLPLEVMALLLAHWLFLKTSHQFANMTWCRRKLYHSNHWSQSDTAGLEADVK